jgi:flagellar protein FlgJ
MSPLLPAAGLPAPADTGAKPAKVRDAAQQFEALLIGQILRSARGNGGWLGSSDSAADSAAEYAEQQFAQALAQRGGLGLADLIARGLDPDNGSR